MNSRDKGERGERELAAYLSERGFPAQRGCQFKGSPDSPDVVCSGLPLHFEVKRCERLSVYDAYAQAVEDAGQKVPVVAHRRNGQAWLAILGMDDLLTLLGRPWNSEEGTARPLDDDLCDK